MIFLTQTLHALPSGKCPLKILQVLKTFCLQGNSLEVTKALIGWLTSENIHVAQDSKAKTNIQHYHNSVMIYTIVWNTYAVIRHLG